MKKLIALLLALVMVIGLAACGAKEEAEEAAATTAAESSTEATEAAETATPKEEITLHYYVNNGVGEQAATADVEAKLNEILDNLPGYEYISIDLHPMKDVETEFTLAQTAEDPIDFCTTYAMSFSSRVADGDFLCLDDLVAQFPDVASDMPDFMLDYGKINGEQYYIPSYQKLANLRYIGVPEEYFQMYVDYTGNDEAKVAAILEGDDIVAKLDFLEDLCLAVREGTGLQTKWIDVSSINWELYMGNREYIGANYNPVGIFEGEDPTYFALSDEFKTIYERVNQWSNDGLLHPDCMTIEPANFKGANILNDESFVNLDGINTCTTEYMEQYVWTDVPTIAFCTTTHSYIPSQYAAGGNAIYVDTKYPEECMMIIELMMTEKCPEFYNTLCYGVEGVHWEWADEENNVITKLEVAEGATYTARAWAMGNTFNKSLTATETPEYYQYIDEVVHNGPDTVTSPVMGISWDLTSVQDQIDQCYTIYKDGWQMLTTTTDFDTVYNDLIAKLKLAGVEDIMTEVTAQYEAYLAG